jgi:hypothetical protein
VAGLIHAEGIDGTDASSKQSTQIILESEYEQALRDRSFFSPFGYEDGDPSVLSIDDMMTRFRQKFADSAQEEISA